MEGLTPIMPFFYKGGIKLPINLEFFLRDNGRLEYSKDLSLTQYSTDYRIVLYSKVNYPVITVNITKPDQVSVPSAGVIKTTDPALTRDSSYSSAGEWRYCYVYNLGRDVTGAKLTADKGLIKLSFCIYLDVNRERVINTPIAFLTLLKSQNQTETTISTNEYSALLAQLNEIQQMINDAELGELDTAKNYNTISGNIKTKFDEVQALIGNLNTKLNSVEQSLGTYASDLTGDTSNLTQTIDNLRTQLSQLSTNLINQSTTHTNDLTSVNNTISSVQNSLSNSISSLRSDLTTVDNEIRNDITRMSGRLSELEAAGFRTQIVESLPNSGQNGILYLIEANDEDDNSVYDEFLWINNAWELIGHTKVTIPADISEFNNDAGYVTSDDLPTEISNAIDNLVVANPTTDENTPALDSITINGTDYSLLNDVIVFSDTVPSASTTTELKGVIIQDPYGHTDYWKIVPDVTTEILNQRLSEYAKTETIPTTLNALTNDAGFITESEIDSKISTALTPYIQTSTVNSTYATKSELSDYITTSSFNSLVSSVNGLNDEIYASSIGLVDKVQRLQTSVEVLSGREYASTFDNIEQLTSFIQDPSNALKLPLGATLFIKTTNTPDFWISERIDSTATPVDYGGFSSAYYELEPIETGVTLSNYTTTSEFDSAIVTLTSSISNNAGQISLIRTTLAGKENVSNKFNGDLLSESSHSTHYPTNKAVCDYVSVVKSAIEADVEENYLTKVEFSNAQSSISDNFVSITSNISGLTSSVSTINDALASHITNTSSAFDTAHSRIASVESSVSTNTSSISHLYIKTIGSSSYAGDSLISRITANESSISNLTSTVSTIQSALNSTAGSEGAYTSYIQTLIGNQASTTLSSAKAYTDEKVGSTNSSVSTLFNMLNSSSGSEGSYTTYIQTLVSNAKTAGVSEAVSSANAYTDSAIAAITIGEITESQVATALSQAKSYTDSQIASLSSTIASTLSGIQSTFTYDSVPTQNSPNLVNSSVIYEALQNVQPNLTFDDTPTANSNNPVKSGGLKTKFDDYYTKSESDQTFLKSHQSLSSYYTKSQVDALIPSATSDLTNDSNYITTTSLADYYTKTEIDNKGFLSSHQSLDNYYTKSEVDSALSAVSVGDLSGYYTKTESDNRFIQSSALSDYYTKSEVESSFVSSSHLSTYYYTKADSDSRYLRAHQSLANYYTKAEVNNKFLEDPAPITTTNTPFAISTHDYLVGAPTNSILLITGEASSYDSGNISLLTGDNEGSAGTGYIKLQTGEGSSDSGDIYLITGDAEETTAIGKAYYYKGLGYHNSLPSDMSSYEIATKGDLANIDLTNYYTKSEIDNKGYLTSHQSLDSKQDKFVYAQSLPSDTSGITAGTIYIVPIQGA